MGKKVKGNGEGTLYFSETLQKWVGQYYYNGSRKTMTQKKNEKASDFKKKFNAVIAEINAGTHIEKCKDTCLSILEKYIEQKHIDGITSDRSYMRDLDTFNQIKKTCSNWINLPVADVTADDIEKSKSKIRKYANNTIDKIWTQINKIFQIAVARRKIIFNPMNDETLAKPISLQDTKPVESLTVTEESKLREALDNIEQLFPRSIYLKEIVNLQLEIGARIGEVLALSRDCFDLENNTITIYRTVTRTYVLKDGKRIEKRVLGEHTKTYDKKTGIDTGKRTFPMTPKVKKIVTQLLNQKISNIHGLLFYDYKSNSIICDNTVNSFLDRLNQKCNISADGLHTHRLRHTFITRCREKGMPVEVIKAIVGHTEDSNETIGTYTSVSLDYIAQELKKMA